MNLSTNNAGPSNAGSKKKKSQQISYGPQGIGNHSIVHTEVGISKTKRHRRPIDTFTMNTQVAKTMRDFSNHENYVLQSQNEYN